MAVLPMFPLGSVLLPGEVLPLHIFEPRYRALVIDLLADDAHDPDFGVILIERGHEVGGGDQRGSIGTRTRLARVEALDEHRYAVIAIGIERLRVNAWLPDDPYPLADVDAHPDASADEHLEVEIAASHARVSAVYRMAAELGDVPDDTDMRIADDPVLATYQLVSLSPLGPADRYRLLAAGGLRERLELLDRALDDLEATLRFRAQA